MLANAVAENVLGTIGAVCWSVQLAPQVVKSYRLKNTAGLSANMLAIWWFGCIFLGAYVFVQNISIPLLIQPQCFCTLSAVCWAQCLYYDQGKSRRYAVTAGGLACVVAGGLEAALIFGAKALEKRGNDKLTQATGIISAVLIVAGLIPQYLEIYRYRAVIGISLIFLMVDLLGGLFSTLSLVFASGPFDSIAAVSYGAVAVLELGVFVSEDDASAQTQGEGHPLPIPALPPRTTPLRFLPPPRHTKMARIKRYDGREPKAKGDDARAKARALQDPWPEIDEDELERVGSEEEEEGESEEEWYDDPNEDLWIDDDDAAGASEKIEEYWESLSERKRSERWAGKGKEGEKRTPVVRRREEARERESRSGGGEGMEEQREATNGSEVEEEEQLEREGGGEAVQQEDEDEDATMVAQPDDDEPQAEGASIASTELKVEDPPTEYEDEEEELGGPAKPLPLAGGIESDLAPPSTPAQRLSTAALKALEAFEEAKEREELWEGRREMRLDELGYEEEMDWEDLVERIEVVDQLPEVLGGLMMMVFWAEEPACTWVDSKTVRTRAPQRVIDFYEQHLKWPATD
ncbi:Cystinosin/ERS1p repeat protein [Pseudohyphozyma bogoriensis]|nr:Cystinosin/ERS1p repeat protein [Pseudohyphozyma bogoriensis]